MKYFRCSALIAVLMLLLPFVLFSCSKKEAKKDAALTRTGKYGGSFYLATISDPKSFNIILAKETSTTAPLEYLFEGLTETDGVTTDVKPSLAESWEIKEGGRVYIMHLRKGVKWSDGETFTSKDVVFTYNDIIFNPDIPTDMRDIFLIEGKKIGVKAIDDYTVEFSLPFPQAPFLRQLSATIMPEHVLSAAVKERKFNSTWGVNEDPKNIIGTGPYRMVEYKQAEKIVYERNPYYWRKADNGDSLPYIDRIILFMVPDLNTLIMKFEKGELDYLSLRPNDYGTLKANEANSNYLLYNTGPDLGTNFIVFNMNPEKNKKGKPHVAPYKLKWFRDLRFRQAVAHAIDKQSMIRNVYYGLGFPQDSAMSPSAKLFYNPNVKKYEYNLDKSRDLLAEMGFKDKDGDGILEDPDGKKLEINLNTNSGNDIREKIVEIIRDDLKKAGIKVNFQLLDFNFMVEKLDNTYDWEAIMIGLTGGIEPHFGRNVWWSGGQLHMWYPKQKKPDTAWEKEIDDIYDMGVKELDQVKRKALYDKWQVITAEQVPYIYTVNQASLFAIRKYVKNTKPSNYGGLLHNYYELYIQK